MQVQLAITETMTSPTKFLSDPMFLNKMSYNTAFG